MENSLTISNLNASEMVAVGLALRNPQRVIDALMVAVSAPVVEVAPKPTGDPDLTDAIDLEVAPKAPKPADSATGPTYPVAPIAASPSEPTAAVAPVAPATVPDVAPPANPGNVELDADGIPWDTRIHSGGKTKLKGTDTWKIGRNKDPELVRQVIEELKAAVAAPAAPVGDGIANDTEALESGQAIPAAPTEEPAPSIFADTPATSAAPATQSTPPPVTPAATPQPAVGPTPPADTTEQLDAAALIPPLVLSITERQSSEHGAAYAKAVQAALTGNGLASINALAHRPDLIPKINQELDAVWTSLNTPS